MLLCFGVALLHTLVTTIRFLLFVMSISRGASSFYVSMFRSCVYIPWALSIIAGILLLMFLFGCLAKKIEKGRTINIVVLLCASVLMMPLVLVGEYILIGLSAF